jgi:hypothetical protein
MKELSNIYKEVGQQFVDDLFKDYLVVTEKLSGSSFSFEKEGSIIKFYKSNDKSINLVDRTLMIYYENAISYIKKVTSGKISTIPDNWRFCFQYFVHNEPGVIQYDTLPKNNLVLTHIQIKSPSGKIGKIIEDPRVIQDWANVLNVTPLLPIFKGYLTDEQKQKIQDFITTPREDQRELFKTSSFAEYIVNVLNTSVKSTMLQSDLSKPIDSIVFKFYKPGANQTFSAKMIDPYTVSLMKDREPIDLRRVPADINEILLLDILAFIEERGLRGNNILSTSPDERYVELISNIFNDYIIQRGAGLKNIDIEKADFAKGDEFKLNIDLIPSETTKKTLEGSERLQDLFKIMLGSLRKKRSLTKVGNVLTPSVIVDFNLLIGKIEELINTEVSNEFKTFGDYLNLKSTNESVQSIEDLVLEESALSINEFINLNKIDLSKNIEDVKFLKNYDSYHASKINESIKIKRADGWINSYLSFSKIKDYVNPKFGKELLRANFGANDDTAEMEIQKFLLSEIGIDSKNYTIERIPVGTFVPAVKDKISSDYDSYQINITNTAVDTFGQSYKKGDVFYITNRYKISKKTGEVAIIGKKNLTPDAMGLPLSEYKNAASLFSKVESFVNSTNYPDNYKNFILQSTRAVMSNSENSGSFDTFESYANSNKTDVTYDINDSLFVGIDQLSINNFANDYGEVLGGFMLFNILKDTGGGLRYPTASNERLVDFYFDDYSISSKAGKRSGTPTGDTIIQKIYLSYSQGHLGFDTIDETDFLNNVIKPWVNPMKLSASTIYNNVMNLCSVNITDKSNSAYWYLVSQVNVQPNQLTEKTIVSHFDKLHENVDEFKIVLSTLWDKSGFSWNENMLKEYTDKYMKLSKKIGIIFYPLMVEITKDLNSKYKKQLTKYSQLVTDIKQLYLDVNIKKGTFSFKTIPFTGANFAFDQKGSIPKPFNANIGIKIEK